MASRRPATCSGGMKLGVPRTWPETVSSESPPSRFARPKSVTCLIGYSYKLTPKTNMNLSMGIGVTKDAPDVQLTLRFPTSF